MSDDQMLHEHQQTWRDFCKILTWSTVCAVVTLILMGIFLVD